MVLISIHPFLFRKILLAIVALLFFSALCFADPVLMVRRYTIRGERSDNLKTSSEKLGDSLASSSVPLASCNGKTTDGFDAALSGSESRPAELGGLHRWQPNSFRLGNPACVRHSTISPAGLHADPLGIRVAQDLS
jgi:hypothetical protein